MNRIFNVIWSTAKEKWVVVSEKVKSNGGVPKSSLLSIAVLSSMLAAGAPAYAIDPGALPAGGQITAGAGSIGSSGTRMTVNQSSQQMIANWSSFNIGTDASVQFIQPNVSATALNHIADQNPTQILGSLSANGKVFLLNQAGIIFGKNARVDVGGLVASSLDMRDSDFLAARYKLSNSGNAGEILNQGSINTFPGGVVALIGPKVINEGAIAAANGGSVALGAGNQVSLDLKGDGLITFTVDEGAVDALVENKGLVKADGGLVVMTARAADVLTQSAVNNSGIVQARSMEQKEGRIILDAVGGMTTVSGTLDASSTDGKGGQVVATGDRVWVKDGAHLTASGVTGGGEVLVGGNWQGKDTSIHQATGTIVESGALLEANATDTGNGGTVVAWSDVNNPLSVTRAYGTFEAMGGLNGGDGGRIETSGHWLDVAGSQGGASATLGQGGLWLFDPYNVTIDNVSPSSGGSFSAGTPYTWTPSATGSHIFNTDISGKLNSNLIVTITTTGGDSSVPGDINVTASINKTSGSSDATLNLVAAGSINIGADIGNTTGTLNLNLTSGTGNISGTGNLTGNGNGATSFTVGGNVSGIYSGNITSRTTLDKYGAGTLVLSGNNSYTGLTDIHSGTLKVSSLNALGTTSNGTRVESGATLEIGSNITNQEFLQLNGNGVNGGGALLVNTGNYSFNGAIELQTAATITSAGGATLTLSNTGEGVYGPGALIVSGNGGVIFDGTAGAVTSLESVTGSAGTALTIKGGFVATQGSQNYSGPTTFDNASGTILQTTNKDITANGTVTSTAGLLTFDAGSGNVSLNNTSNDFSTVQVMHAGAVSLIDKNALTLSGVNATGAIDIATLTNDLTLNGTIITTNASSTAILLNAAKNTGAGTATGGDIILISGAINVGPGGIATLYTGSISGSTALASLIGTGTGRFRYNSDEASTNYTKALDQGLNEIYRETPAGVTVTAKDETIIYGSNPKLEYFFTGLQNSDTITESVSVDVSGTKSSSGNYFFGPHTLTPSVNSLLGYTYSYVTGSLTVQQKGLVVTAPDDVTKTYNGLFDVPAAYSATVGGLAAGDVVNTAATLLYVDKNVGTNKTVNVSGLTLKDGSGVNMTGNYNITYPSITGSITQASLTVTTPDNVTKTYNGLFDVPVAYSATVGGLAAGDVVNTAATLLYVDKNVGTNKTVNVSGLTLKDGSGVNMTGNYNITYTPSITGSITQASLNVTTPDNVTKTYNGLFDVPVAYSATVGGLVTGDVVNTAATLLYVDKNVGTNKTVNGSGLTLKDGSGVNMTGNYNITYTPSITGIITQASLTVTTPDNVTKTYNGLFDVPVAYSATVGSLAAGDVVNTAATLLYADKNVGANKTINVSGLTLKDVSGSNMTGNYSITYTPSITGSITQASLTVMAPDNVTKIYNGLFDVPVAYSATLGLLATGDSVNSAATLLYADKNVGTNKTINVSGLTLKDVSGSNMTGNYNITYTSSITGSITQASLIVTTPDNVTKTYNGLFDVPVAYSATVGNLVAGDLVNTAATLLYVDKNVGTNKTVNVSGLTLKDLSGSNMTGNYSITYTPSITGSITQASLTVMAPNSVTKIYNGLFDVPVAYSATLGLLATGDSVNSAATLLYADKNVGTNKTINVSGLTLKDVSGSNMTGNYSITYTPSITGSITPAPLTVTARNQTKLYDGSSYSGGNGVVFEPVPSSSDYDGTLVYTGTSQGAIQRGTYVITPGGYTSSNYNITFADGQLTILSSVPTPQEWFVSNIPSSPPATLVQVNVGDKTQGNESGVPGLKSMDAVSGNEQPVTRVFMPEEFVRSSSSFIFPLPENVQSQLSGSIGPENVFLQDGSPLPSWLQYDAQNKVFRANHAPEGAIPVTVIVKQGDLSWSVVILQ